MKQESSSFSDWGAVHTSLGMIGAALIASDVTNARLIHFLDV
ncbi:MAG: hypothetical protein AAF687_09295 [Pseudomonadota bacterium]